MAAAQLAEDKLGPVTFFLPFLSSLGASKVLQGTRERESSLLYTTRWHQQINQNDGIKRAVSEPQPVKQPSGKAALHLTVTSFRLNGNVFRLLKQKACPAVLWPPGDEGKDGRAARKGQVGCLT